MIKEVCNRDFWPPHAHKLTFAPPTDAHIEAYASLNTFTNYFKSTVIKTLFIARETVRIHKYLETSTKGHYKSMIDFGITTRLCWDNQLAVLKTS